MLRGPGVSSEQTTHGATLDYLERPTQLNQLKPNNSAGTDEGPDSRPFNAEVRSSVAGPNRANFARQFAFSFYGLDAELILARRTLRLTQIW